MGRNRRPGPKARQQTKQAPASNPCRVCGKPFTVSASGLGERASVRLAKRSDVCSSCWLAEEAAIAAPKAVALGLPELVGTPGQKLYAVIARQQHVDAGLPLFLEEGARRAFLGQVASQTDAKWWIENRKRSRARRRVESQPGLAPGLETGPLVQFDGGCTRNPGGVGSFGALLKIGGQVKDAVCGRIGKGETSNRAEYRGLIEGLKLALKHLPPGTSLLVLGDSKLVIRQMQEDWRVLHQGLLPLWQEAQKLSSQLGKVSFRNVPRASNSEADRLARAGLNGHTDAMAVLSKRSAPVTAAIPAGPDAQASLVVAVAAGGQGARMAAGAVMQQGDVEIASFSLMRGPGEKFSAVVQALVEKVLRAAAQLKPGGGTLTILSVEQTLFGVRPSFSGWTVQVRRPSVGGDPLFGKAKALARHVVDGAREAERAAKATVAQALKDKKARMQVPKRKLTTALYPGASTVDEFNQARETARKLGLPRLMYGTELQHEHATNIRHDFVSEKLRLIEALHQADVGAMKARLLGEIKKQEFSLWWLEQKDRLHEHFAAVLPPARPVSADIATFSDGKQPQTQ